MSLSIKKGSMVLFKRTDGDIIKASIKSIEGQSFRVLWTETSTFERTVELAEVIKVLNEEVSIPNEEIPTPTDKIQTPSKKITNQSNFFSLKMLSFLFFISILMVCLFFHYLFKKVLFNLYFNFYFFLI